MTRTADRMAFLALGLLAALAVTLPEKPATAQGNASSRSSQGASPGPFDLQLAIHEHFSAVLPAGWWIGPPQRWGDEVVVRVNIPESWNGNPTAAMMPTCPARNSPIWQATDRITLSPHYRNLSWAAHQCLP
ncbi:hypothetical protein [Oceanibaculum nanhaiense]|uniref:hypothetical protein n=1 Tax=Oceanibaculum nanhaiense TaxID=1909734 RepID=UPI003D29EB73